MGHFCGILKAFPMRKPLPPPVVIDNWPHPPIILETTRPRPKRICGVFVVINFRWEIERRLCRGTYFSSTKAASRAMGFQSDRVGKLLRKNRGTKIEGYALFPNVGFMSAKAMLKRRIWHHEPLLRYHLPWALEPLPPMKMVFLPKGDPECVRWVPIEEPDTAAAKGPSEPEELGVPEASETILD